MGLVDSLTAIRQGRVLRSGQKVLLVLDQFEQWLHARRGDDNTELVAALRHCDGEHLQAVVMVRDDFWLAVTRFMDELEIELLKGQNTALVDLFDMRHARKVLTAFGTAYGSLPERTREISRDQDAFLDQAITELAQDGKVISVRLALFAEMVKGKSWTPAAFRDVGGAQGVGVAFLEETFSSPQANPKHRLHQKAAQAVLKALLPETGTEIKGQMRAEAELQETAGYTERPREFADLIHILDGELRLITPTDPEGVAGDGWGVAGEEVGVAGDGWGVAGEEVGVAGDGWGVTGGEGGVAGQGWRKGGEDSDDRAELPTVGGVAVRHGTGGEVLSGDEGLPKGGAVWADKSDPTVGGVDPGEHRRRTGEGAHQGIPQSSEHCPRIADGAGNAPDAEPAGRIAATGGTRELVGADRSHQPNVQRPAQSPGEPPRQVTATNPATHHPPPTTRYYQLTHDYLVHSLRDWLTRKQRETRRGRAALRLAERSAIWNAKPENRRLPSALEWANIRALSRKRDWTETERRMMARAGRFHGLRALGLAAAAVVLAAAGLNIRNRVVEANQATAARGLVRQIVSADTAKVPDIIRVIKPSDRRWTDPELRQIGAERRKIQRRSSMPASRCWPSSQARSNTCTVGF